MQMRVDLFLEFKIQDMIFEFFLKKGLQNLLSNLYCKVSRGSIGKACGGIACPNLEIQVFPEHFPVSQKPS